MMSFFHIRKADEFDCDLVFSLSNDQLVRLVSFNTKPIEYEQHCKWFAKAIVDTNTLFFLVFADDSEREFVGQIRFNRESEQSSKCVISLSITKEFRGKHIAKQFIELGIEEMRKNWYDITTVIAEVKDENAASNALFLKEGFDLISTINTYKLVILPNGGGYNYRVVFADAFPAVREAA